MEEGRVEWFNPKKGFGFIESKNGESLFFHYSSMIRYEIQHLVTQWLKMRGQLDFPAPVPIILSGGTALVKGFKELWEKELDKVRKRNALPFQVKEIRMAKDPLGAVARGLLIYAMASEEGEE